MKKKNLYLILVVFILGIIAIVLMGRNNTRGTINRELRDFAVQDTAAVDKIFMVNKANEHVTLTRQQNQWVVNGKYIVREDAINMLLKTLYRVSVKSPVSKSAMDNVVKMLATRNTKVEVYSKNKLIKTIYVGGPTQDQMGTFMMLEGSSVPFVVSIPGFVGYLSTRFFIEEQEWRSPLIFNYDFNQITSVKSINNDLAGQSFEMSKNEGQFRLRRLPDQFEAPAIDTMALRFYMSNFERVASEFFVDALDQSIKDSLAAATPFRVLEVTDVFGQVRKVEAHRRPPREQADPEGPIPEHDPERMYARIDDHTWVVIQFFVFDLLFRDFDFFLPLN